VIVCDVAVQCVAEVQERVPAGCNTNKQTLFGSYMQPRLAYAVSCLNSEPKCSTEGRCPAATQLPVVLLFVQGSVDVAQNCLLRLGTYRASTIMQITVDISKVRQSCRQYSSLPS
jgi:hypothetical protein